MRILLIEPRSCFRGLSPGLAYLCAVIKKAGHEVYAVSLTNHREYDPNQLQRYFVDSYKPDIVGYSIYYTSVHSLSESLLDLRTYFGGPVVVGGPQMNIERAQLLRQCNDIDYAVVGEAEITLLELIEALSGKRDFSSVNGLIYRKGEEIIVNPERPPNRELDQIPFPDYGAFGVNSMYTYYLVSSRGCPYRCTFCNRNSDSWRSRTPANLVEELEHAILRYQCREFCIVDDSFNVRPERIIEFCDLLLQRNIKLPWTCSGARADKLDERMLTSMRTAGCYRLAVGIESLQPEVYARLNKGESLETIISSVKRAKEKGFEVEGYFMIGIPGDSPAGVMDTYKRAQHLNLDSVSFSILLPFPGTRIYEDLVCDEGTKWLRDYKTVTTAWTFDPEWSEMKSSFELPGFTEKEKVDLFHRIRTRQADPRPPYRGSLLRFGFSAFWYILKYDPLRAPLTVSKIFKNILSRLLQSRGKTFSKIVVEYKPGYLPSPGELKRSHGQ
jgi:anaerobic magnesium-protoporphyrin IX monomethyl ester cyclase